MTDIDKQHAPYPWQMAFWNLFLEQYDQARLPHALLLSGPAGTGKRDFATALASRILCATPGDKACGQCKGCLLRLAGSHPDLLRIEPEEKSKAIKVDQIRRLKGFSGQTAQLNGYKVIVLQPADALNINAANALLKDLEEPPARTLFLLVTDQADQLTATIRSRCNQMVFAVPDSTWSSQWLAERVTDQEQSALALRLTDNAPLLALQLCETKGLEHRKSIYRGLAEVLQHKVHSASIAQTLQDHDLFDVIHWVQIWVNDLVKVIMTGGADQVKNQDLAGFLQKTAEHAQLNRLYLYLDYLQKQRQALLLGHNPNKILLLETLLIGWSDCFKR